MSTRLSGGRLFRSPVFHCTTMIIWTSSSIDGPWSNSQYFLRLSGSGENTTHLRSVDDGARHRAHARPLSAVHLPCGGFHMSQGRPQQQRSTPTYEDYSNLVDASQSHTSITDVRSRRTDIDPVCSGRTRWRLRAARPPQRLLSWELVVKVLPWRCRPVKPLASDLHGSAGIQSPDQPTQTAEFEPSLTISRQHRNVGMRVHAVSACRFHSRFAFETMQLSKLSVQAHGQASPRSPGNASQPKASPEECILHPRLSISNPINLPPRPLLILRYMLLLSASRNRHSM